MGMVGRISKSPRQIGSGVTRMGFGFVFKVTFDTPN